MFDVSFGEMLLIASVALIVLGPEKLPDTARWLGRTISKWRNFVQKTHHDIQNEFQWNDLKQWGHSIEKDLTQSFHHLQSTLHSSDQTSASSQPTVHAEHKTNTLSVQEFLIMDQKDSPLSSPQHLSTAPMIGVVMGSASDWKVMKQAAKILKELGIPFEAKVVSAHRMPDTMFIYGATARDRGLKAIIAGAGGAAHLPGMLAAKTTLPVLGVPIAATLLHGQDSLYSIVQMPKGIPVATFAIGEAGAANAALFAASLLANYYPELIHRLEAFRAQQTAQASQSILDIENLD